MALGKYPKLSGPRSPEWDNGMDGVCSAEASGMIPRGHRWELLETGPAPPIPSPLLLLSW